MPCACTMKRPRLKAIESSRRSLADRSTWIPPLTGWAARARFVSEVVIVSEADPALVPLRNSEIVEAARLQRMPNVPFAKLAMPGLVMRQSPGVCGASRQSVGGGGAGFGGAAGVVGTGRGAWTGGLVAGTQAATRASAVRGAVASSLRDNEWASVRRRGFAFIPLVWNEAPLISSMQSHD